MQESIHTRSLAHTRLDPPHGAAEYRHPKRSIGILAFGSLISDPGAELDAKLEKRILTKTPFPVEYGRYSGTTRGGAPTLVPHDCGAPVDAEILVLDDTVGLAEAKDMLWRRECGKIGYCEKYNEGTSPNSVLVRQTNDPAFAGEILYTDFHCEGKIPVPTAGDLARQAICSVGKAKRDRDGVTYLINSLAAGIQTPLSGEYQGEILKRTGAGSLQEALEVARTTADHA